MAPAKAARTKSRKIETEFPFEKVEPTPLEGIPSPVETPATFVGEPVGSGVELGTAVAVSPPTVDGWVGVSVGTRTDGWVGVSVGTMITGGVFVGVSVGGTAVFVGVFVGVDVGVFVAVAVGVFVGVAVAVGVFVAVAVGVFVAVAVGTAAETVNTPPSPATMGLVS